MNDTTQPEKLLLTSLDIAAEKREELRRILATTFPEIMAQDKIDLDQLKRVLGDWVEPDRERFGLNWPGKAACMKVIQAPSVGTLKPSPEESVDWETTQNVFIEGDNLEVLKLLQKAYFGKVKMIYIDPPYNTGKEFIYPDKYSETLETYLEYTGQIDGEGRRFSTNTDASGRFHSRWLNMIYPRLYLAKNLLQNDGMIFISIDDHEQANLKRLCDDIFGEENFVECFVWKKSYGGGPKERYAVTQHEYILMYAKNLADLPPFLLPYDPAKIDRYYGGKDEHFSTRGPYRIKPLEATKSMDSRPNLVYGVKAPDGTEIWPKRQWLWSKERVVTALAKNEVIIVDGDNGRTLNYKQYLRDEAGEERGEKPFSVIDGIYTQQGTDDLRKLFNDKVVLQFPKPVSLIEKLVSIAASSDSDGTVLDFFAGSGTTGEAVINYNSKYNTNINYVLVQLPEPCDQESSAAEFGFRTIADIGKERLRRVKQQRQAALNLASTLSMNLQADSGFKAFSLVRSNFRSWNGSVTEDTQIEAQLELHVDHVAVDSSAEDVLYELLLKDGFRLTTVIETIDLAGKKVFSIADGALLICLDKRLTQEVIDAMADLEPSRIICLDAGFQGNDQLKANAVQTFKARARNRETAIEFRTV